MALRPVQTRPLRPVRIELLLIAGAAIATLAAIVARATVIAGSTVVTRAAIIARSTVVTRSTVIALATLAAIITRTAIVAALLVARTAIVTARRLLVLRTAIVTTLLLGRRDRNGTGNRRLLADRGDGGGDVLGAGRRGGGLDRRLAFGLVIEALLLVRTATTAASATTTTTATAGFTGLAGLIARLAGLVGGAFGAVIISTIIASDRVDGRGIAADRSEGGGVEQFGLARGHDRRGHLDRRLHGNPIPGCGCGHGDGLGGLGKGGGGFSHGRLGGAGLDGGLQCLDQFIAAESAAVGDLVLACKLT